MPNNPEIPLYLHRVLDEENLNLHGPLDDESLVELPASKAGEKKSARVRARRDCLFYRGHIKKPISAVLKLLPPETRHSGTQQSVRTTLAPPGVPAPTPRFPVHTRLCPSRLAHRYKP